ncbi:MAG: hypothetical protein ACREND_08145, partial [Gemmatimonadaceae bacterium]
MASLSSPIRMVRRNPAFFALAAGTLGLALALATTSFAMLDAMRHPFNPYPQPDRAFTVWLRGPRNAPPDIRARNFEALRSARTMAVAAVELLSNTVADAGGTARTIY